MRIAVLLPARRRWLWHDRLIARLAELAEVDVHRVSSPAYPLLLRLWLGLEHRLFGRSISPSGKRAPDSSNSASLRNADLVLNLTETVIEHCAVPTLWPIFDKSPDSIALVGRLLRRQCPMLEIVDQHSIVDASYAAIADKDVLGRGLAQAFGRIEEMLYRACKDRKSPTSYPPLSGLPPSRYGNASLVRFGFRLLWSKLSGKLQRRRIVPGQWNIAYRFTANGPDIAAFDFAHFQRFPTDPEIFYADPFVFSSRNDQFVFVEAYPYASAKGIIAWAKVDPQRKEVSDFTPCLERDYHLSYPYVFEHQDQVFMMPEASESGALELYRCTKFPEEWVLHDRLIEGRIVDPTLFRHEDRYWIFATVDDPPGSSWDELHAWWAEDPLGPWHPHQKNPIKSDCRNARPAGRPILVDGVLLRPAQRCENSYGESIVWLEIVTLTPDSFSEREHLEWSSQDPAISGLHSVDLASPFQIIDYRSDIPRAG